MRNEILLIELPIKWALVALAVFVGSALAQGYLHESMALAAISMRTTGGLLKDFAAIGGLSIDRAIRYLIFYLFIFLAYAALFRSSLGSSASRVLIKFIGLPVLLSIAPFLFSGEFAAGSHWALLALLIALISVKTSALNPSSIIRTLFFLLLLCLLVNTVLGAAAQWRDAMNKVLPVLYGQREVIRGEWHMFSYFIPGALLRMAADVYLMYFLPKSFFDALNSQILREKTDSDAQPFR